MRWSNWYQALGRVLTPCQSQMTLGVWLLRFANRSRLSQLCGLPVPLCLLVSWLGQCFVPAAVPSGSVPTGSYMLVESLGAGEGSLPGELLMSGALVMVENGHMAVPVLNVVGVNISIEPQTQLSSVHTVDVVACDTTSVAFRTCSPTGRAGLGV